MHSFILLWYSSLAEQIPNGILLHRKRPYGVLNVVSRLASSVNSTYQNPSLASNTEKIYAPLSSVAISSIVGNL